MDTVSQTEKNRGRIEKRSAFVTNETEWLTGREEWHYYISSRRLIAAELLHHAQMEWSVKTMHRLPYVHFREDGYSVEDRNIQQNLNMLRKAAPNLIKRYKERARSKRFMSKIMFDCPLNPYSISEILEN